MGFVLVFSYVSGLSLTSTASYKLQADYHYYAYNGPNM